MDDRVHRIWPAGDCGMAARVRAFRWSDTPLGPIAFWPARLRMAVDLVLVSQAPAALLWGPAHTLLHNDAWALLLGDRHPAAFGRPAPDDLPGLAAASEARAWGGEAIVAPDVPLPIGAGEDRRDAWWTLHWLPVRDDDGRVAGLSCTAFETSRGVLADRAREAAVAALREAEASLATERADAGHLHRISGSLIARDDVGTLYAAFLEGACALMRAEVATIQSLTPGRGQLCLLAQHGLPPATAEEWHRVAAGSLTSDAAFTRGDPIVVPDVELGHALTRPDDLARYRPAGIRATLTAPLIARDGRLVGVLSTYWHAVHAPAERELRLLGVLARQAADLIERRTAAAAARAGEERQAYLLRLSDVTRHLADPIAIQTEATRVLAEHLRVDRAMYTMVDMERRRVRVEREHARPGLPSVVGEHALAGFSAIEAALLAQEALVMEDAEAEGVSPPSEVPAYRALGIRSAIIVPCVKDGTVVASMSVMDGTPREWTAQEVALVTETAERTWSAVERAWVEAALRGSEERLRQFGEASQDILWIRDAETLQWQYLTPAFEPIYGLGRDEALLGDNFRNWLDLIVPEDRHHAIESIRRVRAGGHVTFEYRIRRPMDGEIRWLRNTDFPITDDKGQVTLIGGIGHDATEMREIELRLHTLIEGIPQLVWRAIGIGLWTWASPQWTAYTGQSSRDSEKWGWLEPLYPDDRAVAREAWSHAVERGGFEVEYRICGKAENGYRWFQTRAVPVRDEAGTIIEWLGTSTDIHDMRELQEQQKVLVAELQHRTRNLMGVIRSMADKTARASDSLADFGDRFRDRLEALARVQGLLSRLNEHDRVTFDEVIQTELAAMDGNTDRVTLDGPTGVRLRSSTVQTLAMALHELATNAVKYGALGQPSGHLAISWSFQPAGERGKPWLHIDWRERGVAMPPAGSAPQGTGQGRELIERALPYQLSARTSYTLGPDGVHCRISIPVSASGVEDRAHV